MKITKFLAIFLVSTLDPLSVFAKRDNEGASRQKRTLVYPTNSAIGMVIAIAVPLDLPHRNVFVSYNFEGNYNMETHVTDIIPGPLNRLDLVDPADRALGRKNDGQDAVTEPYNKTLSKFSQVEQESDRQMMEDIIVTLQTTTLATTEGTKATRTTGMPRVTKSPHKRDANDALMTRKKVYKMLENKLQNHGHPGKPCLLRAICEEAQDPINEHNGVLGDIIHIILTPSSSVREDLHPEYYKAEELGHNTGDCSKYKKYCSKSIIEYISKVILT